MTYHDPCYLARVKGVHQPRRNLLTLVSATMSSARIDLREMPRRREQTFCCGAGGGRM